MRIECRKYVHRDGLCWIVVVALALALRGRGGAAPTWMVRRSLRESYCMHGLGSIWAAITSCARRLDRSIGWARDGGMAYDRGDAGALCIEVLLAGWVRGSVPQGGGGY